MSDPPSFWSRLRKARLFQVLALYAGASWVILQVVSLFTGSLGLPRWAFGLAVVLLLIGLVVILATAWVQAHSVVARSPSDGDDVAPGDGAEEASERAGETGEKGPGASDRPGAWQIAVGDLGDAVASGAMPHLTWARSLAGGAVVFLLFFGFAGLYVVIQDRGRSFAPAEAVADEAAPAVAVVPFAVTGEEAAYLDEGMVNMLSVALEGAGGLRAIDSRTALAQWERVSEGGSVTGRDAALALARATGARYAVTGSAVSAGPRVRLVADVYDARSGTHLDQRQADAPPDSILSAADRLAVGILEVLLERPESELPRLEVSRLMTGSVPALKAYLEGETLFRRADFTGARPAFQRAVEEDSTFALAFQRLAYTVGWLEGEQAPLKREHLERAVRHSARLPERERILVEEDHAYSVERDLESVERLEAAGRKFPDDAEIQNLLGEAILHLASHGWRPPADAEEAFGRAVELDPGFSPYRIHHVELGMILGRDSAEAARRLRGFLDRTSVARLTAYGPVGFDLLHGTTERRAAATSVLDTLRPRILRNLNGVLHHPAAVDRKLVVVEALVDREIWPPTAGIFIRADYLLRAGRIQGTISHLERRANPRSFGACVLSAAQIQGYPVPDSSVDVFVPDDASTVEEWADPVCAAFYAIARGDRALLAASDAVLEREAAASRTRGDTAAARRIALEREQLQGIDLLVRGRFAEAVNHLAGTEEGVGPNIWIFRGRARLGAGQTRDAADVLAAQWYDPLACLLRAETLEDLRNLEEAREAYGFALASWQEADPGMEPLIRRAREGFARAGGDPDTVASPYPPVPGER